MDSSVAGLLNGTGPLVTVLGAHFITRDELLTKGRMAGVLIGMGGVAILMYDGLSQLGGFPDCSVSTDVSFFMLRRRQFNGQGCTWITPVQLTGFSLILSSFWLCRWLSFLSSQNR